MFYGELDRYGASLEVIGLSEAEVRNALEAEYRRAFCKVFGREPDEFYMESVREDTEVREMRCGEVVWR